MSVMRGRPPGLAGGISGASRAYCSSLRACPAPKSPTSARLSVVHMACLQEGLLPSRTGRRPACATRSPRGRRLLKRPLRIAPVKPADYFREIIEPTIGEFIAEPKDVLRRRHVMGRCRGRGEYQGRPRQAARPAGLRADELRRDQKVPDPLRYAVGGRLSPRPAPAAPACTCRRSRAPAR